eukprot:GHVH01000108.1.p1 GENE.GHVH01000108.1~~GHVH01000108.1.p1  ORF type:complete len:199 (+),score=20.40 GHVH01000108.1:297-893(+)
MSSLSLQLQDPIHLRRLDLQRRSKTRLLVSISDTQECREVTKKSDCSRGSSPEFSDFHARFNHLCWSDSDESEPSLSSEWEKAGQLVYFAIRRESWRKVETVAIASLPIETLALNEHDDSTIVFFDPREFLSSSLLLKRFMLLSHRCSCQSSRCQICRQYVAHSVGASKVTSVLSNKRVLSHCESDSTDLMLRNHMAA